jgi:L-rhamnose mutarotase
MEKHDKLREILIKNNIAEYGDCIVDEISELFGYALTEVDKEEFENLSDKELIELYKSRKNTQAFDYLHERGYNCCDKCSDISQSEDLIWITAEDFEPKENEIVSDETYSKFDSLCEDCYKEEITFVKNTDKEHFYKCTQDWK